MVSFLELVGAVVLTLAVCGAFIPGWNFHVVFASDKNTLKFHQRCAQELEEKLNAKEQQ